MSWAEAHKIVEDIKNSIEQTNERANVVCVSNASADNGKTVRITDVADAANKHEKRFTSTLSLSFIIPGRRKYKVEVLKGTTVEYTTYIMVNFGEYKEVQVGLRKDTWTGIQNILNAGLENQMLAIGDEMTETLSTGKKIVFQLAAIDLESAHQLIWCSKYANELRQHHTSDTNAGGWNASDIRNYLNSTFYTTLSDELKGLIVERTFSTSQGGQSHALQESKDKIFLPREWEIFGANTYAAAEEHTGGDKAKQWSLFAIAANRIKTQGQGGAACLWWESSPYVSYSTYFCGVNTSGAADNNIASYSRGVVPCFQMLAK